MDEYDVLQLKLKVGEELKEAVFSVTEADYYARDFK